MFSRMPKALTEKENLVKLSCLTKEAVMLAAVSVPVLQGGCEKGPINSPPVVAFEHQPNKLNITIGGKPFATYVYEDTQTTRPYFANVKTPSGIQATRNHPPIEGIDAMDHATFHPGIWLAFGSISGHDYWRLKAKVKHEMFVEKPKGSSGKGTFTVRNHYLTTDGKDRVCVELCRYTVLVRR